MWKNIAKARWPCINRVYDYKIEEDNFIIMGKNRSSISNLPFKPLLIDIFKSLEFIHECGYLYRNIEPEHFMLNEEGQLTVVDFRRAKRYVDVKGHLLEVSDSVFNGSLFASNNQVRGFHEGRKDDLESLGYFALLLMGYEIPWHNMNKDMTIKVRSTVTLQELFRGHNGWI
jgi:serine/threonine protein kinase